MSKQPLVKESFLDNLNYNGFMQNYIRGNPNQALSNTLYGLDHRDTGAPVSTEKTSTGMAFFTRPQLNLALPNLQRDRVFMNLANFNPLSVHRYVRCTLDPRVTRSAVEYVYGKLSTGEKRAVMIENSPLVDPNQIFIPALTNTIVSLSGFPDPVLPTYTSKENVRGGQWSIGDGIIDINNAYDINCTFRNLKDSPVRMLFNYWIRYISLVFDGKMEPYYDFLAANEIDYNTRIYVLLLDETRKYVKRIGACGACYPTSPDSGRDFNFNKGNPLIETDKEISVTFKAMGANYDDSILIDEFNEAVAIGCPPMKMVKAYRIRGLDIEENDPNVSMAKIPFNLLEYFNFRGYPFIDYQTYELNWYVSKKSNRYKQVINQLKNI